MPFEPKVTARHLEMLALIAEIGDGVFFDLEVQELADHGLIYDDGGVLRLTRLGRATDRLVKKLDV